MNFIGSNQKITGNGYNVIGSNAVVRGNGNNVVGSNARVYGNDNVVTGSNAQVWGDRNRVTGSNACVMSGSDNVLTGYNCRINGGGQNNRIGSVDDGSQIERISVGPGGVQIALGIVGGGMHQDNRKKKKEKKRSRSEPEYTEGPPLSDLEHDTVAPEDAKSSCIICLERLPCCVAYPCMHVSYCVHCARRLCFGESGTDLLEKGTVKCAECRNPVESIKRIFI